MSEITEEDIARIVKKHSGMTLFIALGPIVFLLVIGFFEEAANNVILFATPITLIAAVSYFIKNVLTDLHVKDKSGLNKVD